MFDEYVDPETATPTIIQAAAMVKYRSNKMDEAVALLKTATENQPNNPVILSTYGLALLDRDPKSSAGAKALEKSLALNPKQQRVRIALAKRYQALEQPAQAIAQLQKAYEAEPLDLMVQQIYFKSLLDNDQVEAVKAAVENFKKEYPENARGPLVEGWFHMQRGKHDAAQQAFEQALTMKSNNEKQYAYAGLAQIYELQKKPQQAVSAWESTIKADPNMTSAYAHWIKIMRELKRDEQAKSFLETMEKDTQAWPPSVVLAQLLVSEKNLNAAISHIKIALERSNNASNVKKIAAGLYQEQGYQYRIANQLDDARASVMEAVKLYPENPDFLANLIQIELIAENIPEAQRLLDAFEKNDKTEGPRLFLQGVIRYAEKNPDEGIKLFRQSWSEAQTEGVADAIYSHYIRTKEKDLALTFAKDWVAKIPNSYKASLILAMAAQENNKRDEAIKWYEKTIAIAPNLSVALNNLAWLYYEDKDERALALAKQAAELAPKSAEILDTYGWILVEMGDAKLGLNILEQAEKIKPDNSDIQEHLKKAKERQ